MVERTDEDLLRATLAAVAPGTDLRDGLERILRGRTGALIESHGLVSYQSLGQTQQLHLVYRLDIKEYRGRRSVQLMVEHLLPVV